MSAHAEHVRAIAGRPEPFEAVPPARLVRVVVRPLTKVLPELIGRPVVTFPEWASEHAADFR